MGWPIPPDHPLQIRNRALNVVNSHRVTWVRSQYNLTSCPKAVQRFGDADSAVCRREVALETGTRGFAAGEIVSGSDGQDVEVSRWGNLR